MEQVSNSEWKPGPKLSDARLLEIRGCNGAYLLSKAEKEALVEECLASRQQVESAAPTDQAEERVIWT